MNTQQTASIYHALLDKVLWGTCEYRYCIQSEQEPDINASLIEGLHSAYQACQPFLWESALVWQAFQREREMYYNTMAKEEQQAYWKASRPFYHFYLSIRKEQRNIKVLVRKLETSSNRYPKGGMVEKAV